MCRPAQCSKCGRTTWAGCGQHVDQVRRSVPAGQWCTCRAGASSGSAGARSASKSATAGPTTVPTAPAQRRGLFRRTAR